LSRPVDGDRSKYTTDMPYIEIFLYLSVVDIRKVEESVWSSPTPQNLKYQNPKTNFFTHIIRAADFSD